MKKVTAKKLIVWCSSLVMMLFFGSTYYHARIFAGQSAFRKGFNFKVPVSFNRTHFIVGFSATPVEYSTQDTTDAPVAEDVQVIPDATRATWCAAYFSPDDNLQHKLIDLINQETKSINLAIYTFTDKKIADALIAARERGVQIEVVADPSFLSDRYTKIGLLHQHGIKVHIYNPQQQMQERRKSLSNIMHNKFVVFKQNGARRSLVWTGSFNFTNSAHISNQENVVVLNDPAIVRRYEQQFQELKKRSMVYQPN